MPSASGAESGGLALPFDLPPGLNRDYLAFSAELASAARTPGAAEAFHWLASDERALARLRRFALLLYQQSGRLALLAEGDRARVFTRHVLDSLNPLSLFEEAPGSLIDVGSGAGLPGIPLAIALPGTNVTLLESREKKAGFLERAAREVGLANVSVICARLEDAGSRWKGGSFEAITIRALGGIADLLRSASIVSAPGARWVYFLGAPERADGVRASVEGIARDVAVVRGAVGGWLLTGRFD